MNKKIAIMDILTFIIGIVLLIVIGFFINYHEKTINYFYSTIVTIILITFGVFSLLFSYRNNKDEVKIINIAIPCILFILFYAIYCLPVFDLTGCTGINSTICLAITFLFGARVLYNISLFFKGRSRANVYKIDKNSLNYTKNYYSFFSFLANVVLFGATIIVIVNTYFSIVDMTALYQLVFLQKSLAEIIK